MKYIEYALYDLDNNDVEIKSNLESAIQYQVNTISVPFALTKFCRVLTKGTNVLVANAIDYPLGISDTKTRNNAIENAIDNGAQKIELVLQNSYLSLKKYDKLRQDILSNLEICQKNNIELSFYLEYRIFTHQALIKACNLLTETGVIKKAYVSTGYMLDNIDDNIIAVILLKQKTNINTIFSGNIWTEQHVKTLIKNDINYIRLNNINSISLYYRYLSNN
jgi:deoxyribose-phosphate aldolase